MSYWVHLSASRPVDVFDGNMTSNVSGIWRKALTRVSGRSLDWSNEPESLGGLDHLRGLSGDAGAQLCRAAAADIEDNPDIYRELEPKNGWGSAAGAARFLRELGDAWAGNPDAVIRVSR